MGLYLGSQKINSLNPTYVEVEGGEKKVAEIGIDNVFSYDESTKTLSKGGGNLVCNAKKIGTYVMSYSFYKSNVSSISFPSLTSVNDYGMQYSFYNCSNLSSVSFPSLTSVYRNGMYYEFQNCSKLSSATFPCLTYIGFLGMGYIFQKCSNLSSVSFPSLTQIDNSGMQGTFDNCSNLSSVSFPSLTSIGSYGMTYSFQNCSKLSSVSFPSLTSIDSYGMRYNNCIKELYFPKISSIAYSNVFTGCNSLTAFHFAAENESTITADTYYSTLWGRGAGLAQVLFDA